MNQEEEAGISDHIWMVVEEYVDREFVQKNNPHSPEYVFRFVIKYAHSVYWNAVVGADMSEEEFVRHVATIEFVSRDALKYISKGVLESEEF